MLSIFYGRRVLRLAQIVPDKKKIGLSAFFLFFLRHYSKEFLFHFLWHIAWNFRWCSLSETTTKWWTIQVKKAPRRLNKIETHLPINCTEDINIYHRPKHCWTISFLLIVSIFFSSDMQELKSVFPPDGIRVHNFSINVFYMTQERKMFLPDNDIKVIYS